MAGFYIWHSSKSLNVKEINNTFSELDYTSGKHLISKDWNAIVFQKTHYNINNYIDFKNGFIFGTGTFSYKKQFYNNALQLLINDIKNNAINLKAFWGSFVIFYSDDNKTLLLRDSAKLQRLYTNENRLSYSSSFVGFLRSQDQKLNINKETITELLSTGLVIGNETIVKEIEFVDDMSNNHPFPILYSEIQEIVSEKIYDKVVAQHAELVKGFVKDISEVWIKYLPQSILNVSITGGLDSRLITAAIMANHSNFDFYSYWRNENSKDQDFNYASFIASYLNKKLHYLPVKQSMEMSEDELKETFRIAHNSSDGVVRPGSFWDEEFSSMNYRAGLGNLPYLRVTGFEGEYYRNMERLPFKSSRSLNSWINWEMIYRFAGNNFTSAKQHSAIVERIAYKLQHLVGEKSLNLFTYKEYYRKAVVPSYRGLQNNVENRTGFIISPFADTIVSQNASLAIPYLGKSLQFEIDMLKYLSMDLAKLPNDYNFDFTRGEKTKLAVTLWQKLPPQIKHKVFSALRGYYKDTYIASLVNQSNFITSLVDTVEQLDLPLNVHKLTLRSVRGKLILNLGYFIKHNQKWLKT